MPHYVYQDSLVHKSPAVGTILMGWYFDAER